MDDNISNNLDDNLFTSLEDAPVFRSVHVPIQLEVNDSENTFQSFSSLGLEKPVMRSTKLHTTSNLDKKAENEFDFWSLQSSNDDEDHESFKAMELATKFSFSSSVSSFKKDLQDTNTIDFAETTTSTNIILNTVPLWIERYYSFFSFDTPTVILSKVKKVLSTNNINFSETNGVVNGFTGDDTCDFVITMYKWSNDQASQFNIQNPTANDNNTILIEVSRRSGCCITFASFYRILMADLGKQLKCQKFIQNATKPTTKNNFDINNINKNTLELNEKCTESLLSMASSDFVDVRQQGLMALVSSTRCNSNKKKMMKYIQSKVCQKLSKDDRKCPLKSVICSGILSSEPEVRRISCELYKNMMGELSTDSNDIDSAINTMKRDLCSENLRDVHTLRTINAF